MVKVDLNDFVVQEIVDCLLREVRRLERFSRRNRARGFFDVSARAWGEAVVLKRVRRMLLKARRESDLK